MKKRLLLLTAGLTAAALTGSLAYGYWTAVLELRTQAPVLYPVDIQVKAEEAPSAAEPAYASAVPPAPGGEAASQADETAGQTASPEAPLPAAAEEAAPPDESGGVAPAETDGAAPAETSGAAPAEKADGSGSGPAAGEESQSDSAPGAETAVP